MKKFYLKVMLLCMQLMVFFPCLSVASDLNTFNFQGRLENADGIPISSTVNILFQLYDDQNNSLWSETVSVPIIAGEFNVVLGRSNPLAFSVNEQARYIGVTIEGDVEMDPKQEITSVLRAGVALSVTNAAITTSKISGPGNNALTTGTSGQTLVSNGDGTFKWRTGVDPVGSITLFGGASAPDGWLLCDGSEISRTTYADLFDIIGTTYGIGDGSTTFNLPNLRGNIPVGLNIADASFDTLGKIGGSKDYALTVNDLPAHTHAIDPPETASSNAANHTHIVDPPATDSTTTGSHSHSGTALGNGSHSHSFTDNGYSSKTVGSGDTKYSVSYSTRTNSTGSAGSHTHSLSIAAAGEHLHSVDISSFSSGAGGDHNHTVDIPGFTSGSTGSGNAHSLLQPYIVLNYIIKY